MAELPLWRRAAGLLCRASGGEVGRCVDERPGGSGSPLELKLRLKEGSSRASQWEVSNSTDGSWLLQRIESQWWRGSLVVR